MLLRASLLSDLQLKTALAEQQKWGGRLGKILVDMNYVSEDIIIKALCKQLNVPRANLENIQVPSQVLMKLDRAFCESSLCVPCAYSHNDRALQVAMTDPTNLRTLDELKFRTGLRIVPAMAGQKAIATAIARLYHSEQLADDNNEEFKLTNSSGATMLRNIADIQPPTPPAPPPPPAVTAPPPPQAAPTAANPWGMPQSQLSVAPGAGAGLVEELGQQQKRQTKAIKTLLELLIEKGVFSREEYVAWMNRRQG